jgi:hypothetical protein
MRHHQQLPELTHASWFLFHMEFGSGSAYCEFVLVHWWFVTLTIVIKILLQVGAKKAESAV